MTAPDNGLVAVAPERARDAALRPIDIAFADYDRTRPLIDGRVKPKGIELRATNKWVGDFRTRPVYEEFYISRRLTAEELFVPETLGL